MCGPSCEQMAAAKKAIHKARTEAKEWKAKAEALAKLARDLCKRDHVCQSRGRCEGCNMNDLDIILYTTDIFGGS